MARAWTVHPAVVALAPWIGRQLGCELELAHLESDWWSELRVEGLRFRGDRLAPNLDEATIRTARVRWDMGRLVRGEDGWLETVEAFQPHVALDLTKPAPESDAAATGPPALPSAALPALRVEGGTARVTLPEEVVEVEGLSLMGGSEPDGWRLTGGPRVVRRADTEHSLALDATWTGRALEIAEITLDDSPLVAASTLTPAGPALAFDVRLEGPAERARLTGSLAGTRLRAVIDLGGLALDALGSRLEGWLPADLAGAVDLDAVLDVDLADATAGEATLRVLGRGLRQGPWRVDDLELRGALEGGRLRVDELDLRAPGNRVAATALDLDLLARDLPKLLATAAGSIALEGTDAGTLRGAELPLPPHAYDVALVLAEGVAQVEGGRLACAGGSATLRDGRMAWDLEHGVDLELGALLAFADLVPLAEVLGLEGTWSGALTGEVVLDGTLEAWSLTATASGEEVVTADVPLGAVTLQGAASAERIQVDRLRIEHPDGVADLSGGWAVSTRTLEDVRVEVRTDQPQRWVPALAEAGAVELVASLDGPWTQPTGSIALTGDGLALPDLPLRAVEVRGALESGVLRAERIEVRTDTLQASGRATVALPLGERALDVQLDALELAAGDAPQLGLVAPTRVRQEASGWSVEGLALEGAAGSLVLDLRAGPDGPTLHASTRDLDPTPLLQAWRPVPYEVAGLDLEVDLEGAGAELALRAVGRVGRARTLPDGPLLDADLDLRASNGRLALEALAVRQGPVTVADLVGELALPGGAGWEDAPLRLEGLMRWPGSGPLPAGDDVLTGPVDGALSLTGSWRRPEGALTLEAPQLAVAGTGPLTRVGDGLGVSAALALGAGDLRVEALEARLGSTLAATATGTVRGAGDLTPWLRGEGTPGAWGLEVTTDLDSLDLAWLERMDLGLRRVGGVLDAQAVIEGTVASPRVSGTATVREGMLRTAGAPPIEALSLDLTFEEDVLTLARLDAEVGSAPLTAHGSYALDSRVLDLQLAGQNLLLARDPQLRLRADADLSVAGPLDALRTTGTLGLRSSRYRSAVDLLGTLDGTPTFESQQTGIHIAPFPEGPLAAMVFDLRVTTLEPIEVRTNVLRADARVDLALGGTGAGLLPEGSVFLADGSVKLPSGTMDLVAGRLLFTRGSPFFPELQVQGESRLLGYDVSMRVLGDIAEPRVELSSIPSLPPDQLLLLVVTGTLPASAGAQRAVEALTVYVAQDFLSQWLADPGDASSIADRLEFESGRDVSESGLLTLEARFRTADAVLLADDHLWIVAERDEFEDYNAGLRFSLDLR